LVVTSYRTGGFALLERLSASPITCKIVQLLGLGRWQVGHHLIEWGQLDISNPEYPLLTCPMKDLTRI
jgi:hypothetical protein